MPNDTTITIYHGNPNGNLELSIDSLYINQFDRIHWVIDLGSNVASIENVHGKKGAPWLFIGGPSRDGSAWTGKVMFAPKKVYLYYITWTEKGTGARHTYDPKIAVKPGVHIGLLLIILFFILGLATVGIRKLVSTKK